MGRAGLGVGSQRPEDLEAFDIAPPATGAAPLDGEPEQPLAGTRADAQTEGHRVDADDGKHRDPVDGRRANPHTPIVSGPRGDGSGLVGPAGPALEKPDSGQSGLDLQQSGQ